MSTFIRRLAVAILFAAVAEVAYAAPIKVKVVVVTTFEDGADTGDKPGEFQFWAEREHWAGKITVPGVNHPVYYSRQGVLGVVSGMTSRAATQIMALVLSGKFDFSRAYWVINGIAGADPADVSLGSAAWAAHVVDGDIAYEVDSREGEARWPYAIIAIGAQEPGQPATEPPDPAPMSWTLNPALVHWAYEATKSVPIPDSDAMKQLRALYRGYPNAQKPPFVTIGDSLGSSRYWHGKAMTQWANEWTGIWTQGAGNFMMTDMEDQGFSEALTRLAAMGKVDFQRVLVLRTASNFCMQAADGNVSESLHAEYAGREPSLEAAYRVGSTVVHALVAGWARYAGSPPH